MSSHLTPAAAERVRPLLRAAAALAACAPLAACATLFSAGKVPVALNSDTPGAEVYVDGAMHGRTPLMLELDNKRPVAVTFKMAGRQDQTVRVGTRTRSSFILLDAANLLYGNPVPIIVDAVTGEWKTLDQRTVNVTLAPAGASAGAGAAVRR